MRASRLTEVRRWLTEANLRPARRLGQNFLVDGNIARIAVELAELQRGDAVLEIGPGCGALTERLLERGCRVVAIEVDARLAHLLRQRLGDSRDLSIILEDALSVAWDRWLTSGFDIVVSNLPYSVGTRILVRLFEEPIPPRRMVVTLQREVVERLIAPPSTPGYGLLSIVAQHLYTMSRPRRIPPTCFYPVPQVESALIRLDRRRLPEGEAVEIQRFVRLLNQVFSARRKQLRRALECAGLDPTLLDVGDRWTQLGISPSARPEELPPAAWTKLARALGIPSAISESSACV